MLCIFVKKAPAEIFSLHKNWICLKLASTSGYLLTFFLSSTKLNCFTYHFVPCAQNCLFILRLVLTTLRNLKLEVIRPATSTSSKSVINLIASYEMEIVRMCIRRTETWRRKPLSISFRKKCLDVFTVTCMPTNDIELELIRHLIHLAFHFSCDSDCKKLVEIKSLILS